MGQGVVEPAEEPKIAGLGFPEIGPVLDVVNIAPAGVTIASSLPGAVEVSGDDGPAHCGGDDPGTPADVDDLRVWPEDDATQ